jgi:hypothetical protein
VTTIAVLAATQRDHIGLTMLLGAAVVLAGIVLAVMLRLRAIIVVTLLCWVQNLILPWWYTRGWINEGTALSLLAFKEILLLALFAYAWRGLATSRRGPLPLPISLVLAYGGYVVLRIAVGVFLLGEPFLDYMRLLRSVVFPFEATLVAFVAGSYIPRLSRSYERVTTIGVAACAALSLVLYFGVSESFWSNYVNIAAYNVNVKGDPIWTVALDQGVSGTGLGRAAFEWLSSFRLIGPFGDPLTAGFILSLGLVLILASSRLRVRDLAVAVLLLVAVLLTFSRSAWFFALTAFVYASLQQRRHWRIGVVVLGCAVAWLALGALRDFFFQSLAAFEGVGHDIYHAQGLREFYSVAVLDPANILGRGPLDLSEQTATLENGFAYMLSQFGAPLVITFAAICLSVERYLARWSPPDNAFAVAAGGLAIATLVVANFSYYALSFTAYYGIWTTIGLALAGAHMRQLEGLAKVTKAVARAQ